MYIIQAVLYKRFKVFPKKLYFFLECFCMFYIKKQLGVPDCLREIEGRLGGVFQEVEPINGTTF